MFPLGMVGLVHDTTKEKGVEEATEKFCGGLGGPV